MIAARRTPAAAPAKAFAHAIHLVFHAVQLALPALAAMTAHTLAPDDVAEDRQAHRPPEHEPEDHHDDPAGMHELPTGVAVPLPAVLWVVVRAFSGGHGSASSVNVNNIYIIRERPEGCQEALLGSRSRRRGRAGRVFKTQAPQIHQHAGLEQFVGRHGSGRRAASPRPNRDAMPCESDHTCSATISTGGRLAEGKRATIRSQAMRIVAKARSPAAASSALVFGAYRPRTSPSNRRARCARRRDTPCPCARMPSSDPAVRRPRLSSAHRRIARSRAAPHRQADRRDRGNAGRARRG